MQDPIPIPSCFSSGGNPTDDPIAATKSGQRIVMSTYRTKIAHQCYSITVTWCKNLLVHGLSISIQQCDEVEGDQYICKVELKPWSWRKHGSKQFLINGTSVDIFWDLKAAKFSKEPEPQSDYYVTVVCEEEVVLLLGDLKKEAYRKTRSRPSLTDAMMVSKSEHIFGKKTFSTRTKFSENGKFHEISIECGRSSSNDTPNNKSAEPKEDPEMAIRIGDHPAIHVKHLQWKFRGNESIHVNKIRVEVYWDVHDWLFSPGLRHALFIFKPISSPTSPLSSSSSSSAASNLLCSTSSNSIDPGRSSEFCLFIHAWRLE